ncbi:MAG TPA: diaminopimelate decarboxylase, partial [Desulfuromonas sp.]|nr:diaminopimelate decarboxylase [Desulfuromonas sp.]
MPMSEAFKKRVFPLLPQLAAHYGTPFHIYDEAGIRATGERLQKAFAGIPGFREYFAVKALPNRRIQELMQQMGFGFDCSSIPELVLARQVGGQGEDIMFTSN